MLINLNVSSFIPVKDELQTSFLPWLTYQQSITSRLQEKAGSTRLQVLGQQWESPNWWDRYVLHIESGAVLHREIVTWAGKKPCWYARSIFPAATYQAQPSFFNRLQQESLGQLIFNENKVKRVVLMHYPIGEASIEYHWLNQSMHGGVKALWVRLSAFIFNEEHPFFLIEILLPGLARYSN